jgi:hypothetical protein
MKSSTQRHSLPFDRFNQMLTPQAITVTIANGPHARATLSIPNQRPVYIGSDSRCHMLLTDPGIAAIHCVISRIGGALSIRAIDKSICINGETIPPTQSQHCLVNDTITLGNTQLTFNQHHHAPPTHKEKRDNSNENNDAHHTIMDATKIRHTLRTAASPSTQPTQSIKKTGHKYCASKDLYQKFAFQTLIVLPLIIGLPLLLLFMPIKLTDLLHNDSATLTKTNINEPQPESKQFKQPLPSTTENEAFGKRLANNVKEILRLSGINADTEYKAHGIIKVTGHFGTGTATSNIIQSRAIQEIKGLQKIIQINLDAPTNISRTPPTQTGKELVRIIEGKDPYVVSRDGSRYYLGSHLPGGAVLVAIDTHELIINTSKGQQRVSGANALLSN